MKITKFAKVDNCVPSEEPSITKNVKFFKVLYSGPIPLKETNRATVTIPSSSVDTPDHVININTNVAIDTTVTSRRNLTYFLPRFNVCFILSSLIIIVMAFNMVHNQMTELKEEIIILKNDAELAVKNYDDLKYNLEELTRRFDDMLPRQRAKRLHLVERDAVSSVGYDIAATSSSVNERADVTVTRPPHSDSGRVVTNQSTVPEQVQLSMLEKSKLDVLSLLNDSKDVAVRNEEKRSMLAVQSVDERSDLNNSSSLTEIDQWESSTSQMDEVMYNDAASENVNNDDNDTSSDYYNSPRTGRAKRSNGREILAVHFMGAKPEITIRDGGSLIAPWYLNDSSVGTFGLSRFNLREGKGAVEVDDAGLYYIYAQVYFLTTKRTNSFLMKLRLRDKKEETVATCSVNAAISRVGDSTEVTCFTSAVRYLKAGEQIYLQGQEFNRMILMREGQTFLGLVRLQKEKSIQKV